ncbi:cytochrome P450 [Rhizohabitans arisaemae]|uniref:cytochrome P450 n=1 Tax=Rhizohabitans arisaemae TaxID=2720610 RepID=UPI0024B04D28|nr:cytochrome P450 [Rhizohabitans arisaemae]
MNRVPRFSGPPLLGLNHRFLRDPVGMFMEAHRRYGDLVELDLGISGSVYAAFHPDGVKQTLLRGRRVHRALLRELLGKGLFTSPSGDDWLRRRRLIQPLFHEDRLAELTPLLLRSLDEVLERHWLNAGTVDLAAEMKRATVAMMVDATFGRHGDVDRAVAREELSFLLRYVDDRLFTFVQPPRSWPTPDNRRYRRSIRTIRAIIADAVRDGRRRGGDEPTFLNGLLASRGSDPEVRFSDEELVDEVLSIFIAGTETTGTALTWALHLLATHPAAGEGLLKEMASELPGDTLTPAVLARLTWPKAIVQEAVRLYPPAWALRRVTDDPVEIGGVRLPAGSRLIVSAYVTHRHPQVWSEPERFDPVRWLPAGAAERPRFSYFPFGAGAHQCMGNMFALLEGELIITRLAQRFRMAPFGRSPVRARPTIALAPVPGPHLEVIPIS